MPLSPPLRRILELLGTGGTRERAERVLAEAQALATPPDVAAVQAELAEARDLITRMHAAAVGKGRSPIRGFVEDIEDLRTVCETLEHRWAAALLEINQLAGTDHVEGFYARVTQGAAPDVHVLIERSSLGTPAAVAARGRVSPRRAKAAVERAAELAAQRAAELAGQDQPPPAVGSGDDDDELTWDDDGGTPDDDDPGDLPTGNQDDPGDDPVPPEPEDTGAKASTAQVRAWCLLHNVPVNPSGAIRREAREAYNAAHKGTRT